MRLIYRIGEPDARHVKGKVVTDEGRSPPIGEALDHPGEAWHEAISASSPMKAEDALRPQIHLQPAQGLVGTCVGDLRVASVLAYELIYLVELPGQQACPSIGSNQQTRH